MRTQISGNKTTNKYNKLIQSQALFGLGFLQSIPLPQLGFLTGIFLANHLASNDELTKTTKRQNAYQRKLTLDKRGLKNNTV